MRASLMLSLGAAVLTTISATFIVPARADPAYTADRLIAVFLQDKEAVEAAKTDKVTRKIRLHTDAETAPPPSTVPSAPVHHVDLLVKFEFDSNRLTPEAKENLTQAATALQDPSSTISASRNVAPMRSPLISSRWEWSPRPCIPRVSARPNREFPTPIARKTGESRLLWRSRRGSAILIRTNGLSNSSSFAELGAEKFPENPGRHSNGWFSRGVGFRLGASR
jgi:hypothetical protein